MNLADSVRLSAQLPRHMPGLVLSACGVDEMSRQSERGRGRGRGRGRVGSMWTHKYRRGAKQKKAVSSKAHACVLSALDLEIEVLCLFKSQQHWQQKQ